MKDDKDELMITYIEPRLIKELEKRNFTVKLRGCNFGGHYMSYFEVSWK